MKKILVPTDFSRSANCALDTAVQLAEKCNGEVVLLHVMETLVSKDIELQGLKPMLIYPFDSEVKIKEVQEAVYEHLEQITTEYPKISITPTLETGNPYTQITKYADDKGIDMIVIGSKGIAGLPEYLIGSNTERVVRHATCPVLAVKGPTDISNLTDIVFATELKDYSPFAINHLKEFQKLLGAHLHLLHVNTNFNMVKSIEAEEILEGLAKEWDLSNYSCRSWNADNIEFGIHFYAQEESIDVVAMATHSRLNTWQLISGSIAEDVSNHSIRPVWTCSFYDR